LVARATNALERGTSRRGFLVGSAMVGSAVAVAGREFVLRPGTAYAAVTGCTSGLCTDGYTEFCCVINSGVNACPPDSFAGGWWRADFSSFCNGTRYYVDCMQYCCGPPTGVQQFCAGCQECRCAVDCDTRHVYCTYFRYGQCHQEIVATGPITCRVVTCVPPYATDASCSPAAAVDNATAEHTSPCGSPLDASTAVISRLRGRTLIQVLLFSTLNVFYVADNGALTQKVWDPGPSADQFGWLTYQLTPAGRCKPGSDVDAQDGFQSNFHVFAQHADGQHVVHLTYVKSEHRWVEHDV
jgi:hypothetical protein